MGVPITLLREARQNKPYVERIGSKEAAQRWSEIAAAINLHANSTSLSCQWIKDKWVRFNNFLSDFNANMQKEQKVSGISSDDLSEADKILEEIQ